MAEHGSAFTSAGGNKMLAADGDERAYTYGGESMRRVPKALPLPCTRACAKATHVAKATTAL
jgi:hypothetical protein